MRPQSFDGPALVIILNQRGLRSAVDDQTSYLLVSDRLSHNQSLSLLDYLHSPFSSANTSLDKRFSQPLAYKHTPRLYLINSQGTSTMSFVTGITINCTSERGNGGGIFRPVQVDAKHPIYQHGIIAPVSNLVDLPLLVYKHPLKATRDMALQNEIAQVLMVGKDGKTTTDFTEKPGSVTIVRKDGKPLTRSAIEAIWMFNDYFLEQLQEDKRIAEQLLNRTDFNNFCEDYKEDRILQGHTTFTRLELPL